MRYVKLAIIGLAWLILLPLRILFFIIALGIMGAVIPYAWATANTFSSKIAKDIIAETFIGIFTKVGVDYD